MFKIKWEDYEDVTWYVSGFANYFYNELFLKGACQEHSYLHAELL